MGLEQKEFIEHFPWESESQKQGFLGFLKWLKDLNLPYQLLSARFDFFLAVAFIAQKNHEAFEWWRDSVAEQISRIRLDMVAQEERAFKREVVWSEEIAALRAEIEILRGWTR